VSDLAADGIPVAVTCRVPKLARQPYYRWQANPVADSELIEADRAISLFDAHGDYPEFGYRFLADEAAAAGQVMAARTAWRICSTSGWFSRFGKKPRWGKGKEAGPPVHDELVKQDFTASATNQLWLADISEHHTLEGTVYHCAVKHTFANRIVGYSIDSRMKSHSAFNALNNAVARRGDIAGCVFHTDRGSQFRTGKHVRALARHSMVRSMGRVGAAGDNAATESSFSLLQKKSWTARFAPLARSCASQSLPGSSGPTTVASARHPSGG
jgi:putative transposase